MPDTYRCTLANATVRPDRADDFAELARTLFNRRNHRYVGGQERMWLKAELVQTVRRASRVYREALSTPTGGPLPFALGYLRVRDGQIETISDTLPATLEPRELARLLSEFVEPGATVAFPERGETWTIEGVDAVEPAAQEP
jgi:hypothetical protein